ncbi:hypothetical protein AMR76_22045 [Vibrio furnissii]|uniref:Zona occludens toxin N-terminal domain-containing protein n=1 Tax=Vibrio furnissii TaxID=29494 RepID=A0A0Q2M6S9_VIBFU|nr:zonular occludens toxin domain-containing protein [Vibrio furnissii]KQH83602.1 hypothetical protein AMR76_22045 [Vibrio furnissii]
MSIALIKGRPGAGKSYECVVHHILPSIKDGRKVVTNIPLNVDHFAFIYGEHVRDLLEVVPFDFDGGHRYLSDPEDYKKYQDWKNDKGQGCLFVLDECHLIFPLSGRGKSQSDLAEKQIEFFSGHRHWGFDFIFLTQSDRKINRLLREDIEICIEVRKNRAMGDKSYRRYVFYYGDGKKGGLIEQGSREYEDKFFPFYKSHTKSEGEVTEANIKDMKKWHQHWVIRIPLVLIVVGVIFSVKNISNAFGDKPKSEPVEVVQQSAKPVRNAPAKPSFKGLPFGEFEIFIEGYSDSSYVDKNGIYHVQKQVYFSASNSTKFSVDLKLDDFYLAGYQVSVYGPCMVRLTYESATKLVYCRGKEPSQGSDTSSSVKDLVSL